MQSALFPISLCLVRVVAKGSVLKSYRISKFLDQISVEREDSIKSNDFFHAKDLFPRILISACSPGYMVAWKCFTIDSLQKWNIHDRIQRQTNVNSWLSLQNYFPVFVRRSVAFRSKNNEGKKWCIWKNQYEILSLWKIDPFVRWLVCWRFFFQNLNLHCGFKLNSSTDCQTQKLDTLKQL